MEVRRLLFVLRRWLLLILLGTALVAGVTYLLSSSRDPIYSAKATLLVEAYPIQQAGTATENVLASERTAKTYAKLVEGSKVLQRTIDELNLGVSQEWLKSRIGVNPIQNTQILEIAVTDTNPQRAAEIANRVAAAFVEENALSRQQKYTDAIQTVEAEIASKEAQIGGLQPQIDSYLTQYREITSMPTASLTTYNRLVRQVNNLETEIAILMRSREDLRLDATRYAKNVTLQSEASVPTSPTGPRVFTNTLLAAILGLILTLGLAFLLEYLDDTLKSPEDVSKALGIPILGAIARFKSSERPGDVLVTRQQSKSPVTEAYRSLRTSIQYSTVDKPIKTLLVTSPNPQEGKSVTIANLAVVMAQAGLSVALVDADLRRPVLHRFFEVPRTPGLTNALLQDSLAVDGCLNPTYLANLKIITCGTSPPNPSELLGSHRMKSLLEELAGTVDMVLLDSPPVGAATDAAVLASRVDGVVLVVEQGKTRKQAASKAKEELSRAGANILGVVLNKLSRGGSGYYYYYYYYQYYYSPDGEKRRRRRRKEDAHSEDSTAKVIET